METVLVVGASGNIGVSVIIAALRSKRNVLAIVRNQAAGQKIFQHVGKKDGITIAEADPSKEDGVQSVVEKVESGKLPAFQHVYSTVGQWNPLGPIYKLDTASLRNTMNVAFETNFFTYRATVPYLLKQKNPNSTFTLITGAAGEMGIAGATAMSQGALFSLANVAARENAETNVRFNEVFLAYRVDYDAVCEEKGTAGRIKASDFARVYEEILVNKDIRGARVSVRGPGDLDDLKYKPKLA